MAIKLNEQYLLTELAGVPYLLPFGQKMADHHTGMQLNETAALIWKKLEEGASEEIIVSELALKYEVNGDDLQALERDVHQCIDTFSQRGALLQNAALEESEKSEIKRDGQSIRKRCGREEAINNTEENVTYFRFGPISYCYSGPDFLPDKYFQSFRCESCAADGMICVQTGKLQPHKGGRTLVCNHDVEITEFSDVYCFTFPGFEAVYEICVEKESADIIAYCKEQCTAVQQEDLFHALRFAYLVAAQQKGYYMLHSASILYQGKAWLFSGSSGTGKSTHTKLWHEQFGTPYVNGDLNLIGFEDGEPVVYGQPWCGTSGIFTAEKYPLGGIVFLKQAKENRVTIPKEDEKILSLLNRTISPAWNRQQLEKNVDMASAIAKETQIFLLQCTKEQEAAATIKEAIDEILTES